MNWDDLGVPIFEIPGWSSPSRGSSMWVDLGIDADDITRTDRRHAFFRSDGFWHWDARKDEDPRHQFCDAKMHDHLITWCHRCDKGYVELVGDWMEVQTPGWASGTKPWQEFDPLHRDHKQARRDFENSTCEGERRKREEWGPDGN